MKKLILFTLLTMTATLLMAGDFQFSLKAGIANTTQIVEEKDDKFDLDLHPQTSMMFGIAFDLPSKSFFNIAFEADYIPKGVICEAGYYDSNHHFHYNKSLENKANYLALHFLGKISTVTKVKIYAMAGPRLDILLSYDSKKGVLDEVYKELNVIDFGTTIGLGIDIPISSYTLFVEGRYSPTISNSYEDRDFELKNSSWEIVSGFRF